MRSRARPLEALGYNVAVHGQKTFNGVAMLSKFPFDEVTPRPAGRATATTMPASSRPWSRPTPARCASRRSICPTATRPPPRNIPTKSAGWIGSFTMRVSGWSWKSRWSWPATYNVIPSRADVHNPAAWTGDALFLPPTREKFRALSQSRADRRGSRRKRRAGPLHVLGLSGRRLAEERRHPHRSPAAVAAGGRPAGRVPASTSMCAVGRSRPTTSRSGSISPCSGRRAPKRANGSGKRLSA